MFGNDWDLVLLTNLLEDRQVFLKGLNSCSIVRCYSGEVKESLANLNSLVEESSFKTGVVLKIGVQTFKFVFHCA